MRPLSAALAGLVLAVALSACGSTGIRPAGQTTRPGTTTDAPAGKGRPPSQGSTRADWRPHLGPVPILLYHGLGTPPPSDPIPGLYVSDATFIAEMRWLHAHGYEAVTLDDVMAAWYHHGLLPPKPVVITFDNGYIPQATFAPAVLARYGWVGVLNEITEYHLAPWRLKQLVAKGWEIDSHSLTHPDLTTLSSTELRYQVAGSRRFLQRLLDVPVNSFCYPSSRYNAAVVAAVKAAGYTNAVTENPGYATRADPFLLNRFEITGGVDQVAADLSQG